MNKQYFALSALAVALFSASSVSVNAAPRDAQRDAPAIVKFLSIGLANAATNFDSIRGSVRPTVGGIEQHAALIWPDHAHFHDCHIGHFGGNGELKEVYMYVCRSTARSLSYGNLFEMVRHTIRAALPVSYAGSTPQRTRDSLAESWTRRGYPEVHLYVYSKDGNQYYALTVFKGL
jgi:hypothetical protein